MGWLRTWGVAVVCGLIGLGLVGYGVWEQIKPREVRVEVIAEKKNEGVEEGVKGEIIVDVAGEVEKPGVYKLPTNSRIGDALVIAGGLSASADRGWVAESLNLAEKVQDGGKIYIPSRDLGENKREGQSTRMSVERVNINSASSGELETLPGIGVARAQAIVTNRPYGKTEELISKAKIPESVYEKIRDRLSVY